VPERAIERLEDATTADDDAKNYQSSALLIAHEVKTSHRAKTYVANPGGA